MLRYQFNTELANEVTLGTADTCLGVFDIDGNNAVEITDPINLISYVFGLGGTRPKSPFPDCGKAGEGVSPNLVCESFNCN